MIVERILQLIEYKGINKRKFYIETGLSNGFLDKVKDIGASKIEQILNIYPEINTEWLITGKGSMLKRTIYFEDDERIEPIHIQQANTLYKFKTDRIESNQLVPLYDIQAAAGIVSLFSNTNTQKPIDHISIPNLPKCDGAIYVNGDSMYPLLKSGDIIMYKQLETQIDNIFWGEMYLVSIVNNHNEEFVMVKWVQKSEKGEEYIKLVSENRHHQPKDFHMNNIKGMALIKASVRINSMY